jgi:hypothetical protein
MVQRSRLTEEQKAHLLRGLLQETLGSHPRPTFVAIKQCLWGLASELSCLFGMVEEDARAKALNYYNNQFSKSSRSIGKFLRVQFDENATQEDILHAAHVHCGWKDWEIDCLRSSAWFQGRPTQSAYAQQPRPQYQAPPQMFAPGQMMLMEEFFDYDDLGLDEFG